MGNRLAKTDNGTGSESYAFDNANRNRRKLVSAEATRQVGVSPITNYASDTNGNTLTDGKHTNARDSQNRLASCATSGTNTSAFAYGADGLRRRMSVTNSGQASPMSITYDGYDGTNAVRGGARTRSRT